MDLGDIGTFLLGVSAILGVLLNWYSNRQLGKQVRVVHEATNGMSEKLQGMAEQRGFDAGHKEAEDEAALRKNL